MKPRSTVVFMALLAAACLGAVTAPAGAALIGIYRNGMESQAQRGEAVKLSGERCGRGGSDHAFRVVVGKRTKECSYRTIVLGRDLEISASERLLGSTPKALKRKAFLGLQLRSGDGAHYQLLAYPLQRKAQLVKTLTDGSLEYLRIAKNVKSIKGVDMANELRLRAFNITKGPDRGHCRILAYVGKILVADFTDRAAGELPGRATGFAVGAAQKAKGIAASFDDVVVRAPNPF